MPRQERRAPQGPKRHSGREDRITRADIKRHLRSKTRDPKPLPGHRINQSMYGPMPSIDFWFIVPFVDVLGIYGYKHGAGMGLVVGNHAGNVILRMNDGELRFVPAHLLRWDRLTDFPLDELDFAEGYSSGLEAFWNARDTGMLERTRPSSQLQIVPGVDELEVIPTTHNIGFKWGYLNGRDDMARPMTYAPYNECARDARYQWPHLYGEPIRFIGPPDIELCDRIEEAKVAFDEASGIAAMRDQLARVEWPRSDTRVVTGSFSSGPEGCAASRRPTPTPRGLDI